MEQATAIAQQTDALVAIATAQAGTAHAVATAVAIQTHNSHEAGYALISLDAHLGVALVVMAALIVFDRTLGSLWARAKKAVKIPF